ncbi:MAG TPA: prephenate dehydrogenase, partial [Algoriphagus sp.]|nr:prephenate dehydrogenase [Algoriphagus sp.]
LTENKDNILASLDGYISNLTAIREKIASSDGEAIYKELEEINKIRDILDLGR